MNRLLITVMSNTEEKKHWVSPLDPCVITELLRMAWSKRPHCFRHNWPYYLTFVELSSSQFHLPVIEQGEKNAIFARVPLTLFQSLFIFLIQTEFEEA